jgi:hypothetical protein
MSESQAIEVHVQHNNTCSHGRGDSSSETDATPTKRWETHWNIPCATAHDVVDLSELQETEDEKSCVIWQSTVYTKAVGLS